MFSVTGACVSNPCKNGGTCANAVSSFTCSCYTGYTGATCMDAGNVQNVCLMYHN